jgi:hypothetical protein
MAQFAGIWGEITGARVIGLTTSENAARQLRGEGLAESWNIARFLRPEDPGPSRGRDRDR